MRTKTALSLKNLNFQGFSILFQDSKHCRMSFQKSFYRGGLFNLMISLIGTQ